MVHGAGDNMTAAIRNDGFRGQRYRNMTGAIIPALMHRIPSELRSQACSGEGSTRMGDLLGSPRVAPLFLGLAGYHSGLPLVVPMGSALPIAIGAGRSSIRSPDRKIRAVEIARLGFFPVFYRVEDPNVRGRSAETAGFLDGRGESYGWKRLMEGMGSVGDR